MDGEFSRGDHGDSGVLIDVAFCVSIVAFIVVCATAGHFGDSLVRLFSSR